MAGKAKPKKHTAKEIAAKVDAATTNRGGGKAGVADRTGQDKGGHAKLECPLCKTTVPDVKSMQIHHEARHPKIPFDETKINNLHATRAPDPAKPKPGIRGSLKNCQYSMNSLLWALSPPSSNIYGGGKENGYDVHGYERIERRHVYDDFM